MCTLPQRNHHQQRPMRCAQGHAVDSGPNPSGRALSHRAIYILSRRDITQTKPEAPSPSGTTQDACMAVDSGSGFIGNGNAQSAQGFRGETA